MSGRPTRWGWHQLTEHWARRIVTGAAIRPGDLVLDIGAGAGALTGLLLERGAQVVAFELHRPRAADLRLKFTGLPLTVVVTDAADLRLPRRPFRVVANPPFSTSVAVLSRLVAPGSRLVRADVVVPWHTARRWVSGDAPGAGRWMREWEPVQRPLPRSAFTPPPPNGVALLTIRRRACPSRSRAVGGAYPGTAD